VAAAAADDPVDERQAQPRPSRALVVKNGRKCFQDFRLMPWPLSRTVRRDAAGPERRHVRGAAGAQFHGLQAELQPAAVFAHGVAALVPGS